jgi:Tol biopolymer transport system component
MFHPDASPDGRHIVFGVDDAHGLRSIWIAGADGTHARVLVPCAAGCGSLDYPAFSPDGRSVVYTHYDATTPAPAPDAPFASDSIRIVDLAAGRSRIVASSDPGTLLDAADFSPSGRRLVVENDRFASNGTETGCRLLVLGVSGGHADPITPWSTFAFEPDWSPKGDLIAFGGNINDPTTASNIGIVRPDGSGLRLLTSFAPGVVKGVTPTFFPDGRRIVFMYRTPPSPERTGRNAAIITTDGAAFSQIVGDHALAVTHPVLLATRGD